MRAGRTRAPSVCSANARSAPVPVTRQMIFSSVWGRSGSLIRANTDPPSEVPSRSNPRFPRTRGDGGLQSSPPSCGPSVIATCGVLGAAHPRTKNTTPIAQRRKLVSQVGWLPKGAVRIRSDHCECARTCVQRQHIHALARHRTNLGQVARRPLEEDRLPRPADYPCID